MRKKEVHQEKKDTGHSFSAYYKRATSPLVVLSLLQEREMYGYEIANTMDERSGGRLTISVLYPVIYRLQEQGFVIETSSEIVEGRARSYYAITDSGRNYLKSTLSEYEELSKVFEIIVKGEGKAR